MGTASFVTLFVTQKFQCGNTSWKFSLISVTQPHVAFTHGIISRWNYLVRYIPDVGDLLCHLEEVIRTKLLPNPNGQCASMMLNVTAHSSS